MPVQSEKTRSINAWNKMKARLNESEIKPTRFKPTRSEIQELLELQKEYHGYDAIPQDREYSGYDVIEEDTIQAGRKAWNKLMHEKKCLSMLQEDHVISNMITKVMSDLDNVKTIEDIESVFVDLINLHRDMQQRWNGEVTFGNTFLTKWTAAKKLFDKVREELDPDIVEQFEKVIAKNDDAYQATDKLSDRHKRQYYEFNLGIGEIMGKFIDVNIAKYIIRGLNNEELLDKFLKGLRTGFKNEPHVDHVTEDVLDYPMTFKDKEAACDNFYELGAHIGTHIQPYLSNEADLDHDHNNTTISDLETQDVPSETSISTQDNSQTHRSKFLDAAGLSDGSRYEKPFEPKIMAKGFVDGIIMTIKNKLSS